MQVGGNCTERWDRSDRNYLLGNKNHGAFLALLLHFVVRLGRHGSHLSPLLHYKPTAGHHSGWCLFLDLEDSSSVTGQPHFTHRTYSPIPLISRLQESRISPRSSGEVHLPDLSTHRSALPALLAPAEAPKIHPPASHPRGSLRQFLAHTEANVLPWPQTPKCPDPKFLKSPQFGVEVATETRATEPTLPNGREIRSPRAFPGREWEVGFALGAPQLDREPAD